MYVSMRQSCPYKKEKIGPKQKIGLDQHDTDISWAKSS